MRQGDAQRYAASAARHHYASRARSPGGRASITAGRPAAKSYLPLCGRNSLTALVKRAQWPPSDYGRRGADGSRPGAPAYRLWD